MKTLPSGAIEQLKGKVKGRVLTPADPDYDACRKIWNAMIDRRPALIVQCAESADVPHAIAAARAHGLEISMRGAGHNIAGNAVCDDGMMIDFSRMRAVRVDVAGRRAQVEPGATLADVDAATQAHGLATSTGINSTTGIAGLTLGGGFGWLTRTLGMTVDNLIAADIVIADGRLLHLSAQENADLFWAIRGGGGNFGAVTRFEFRLRPVGPEITAGLIVFPFDQARQVLAGYRAFTAAAPEEINAWVVLRKAPPLPFLPAEVHGREVVVLAVFYPGNDAGFRELIRPLRGLGAPHGEHLAPMPYVQWQQAFDPLLAPGARNYWKSHNFTDLSDEALEVIIRYAGQLPSPQCEILLGLTSGAANRVPAEATAYAHRDTRFVLNVHGRWEAATDDERCIGWSRDFFKASAPYASAGVYVNFMTADETDRVSAAYGSNLGRLAEIKRRYDPGNVFHLNQNIRP